MFEIQLFPLKMPDLSGIFFVNKTQIRYICLNTNHNSMKKILLSCFLIIPFLTSVAQSAKFSWCTSSGSSSAKDQGNSVVIDAMGNVYTVGTFSGTVDFFPGTPVLNKTATGMKDVFVIKQDMNGALMWVKTYGGAYDDEAYSISKDVIGNLYITGSFMQLADFNIGMGDAIVASVGDRDIFTLKLDQNGLFIWVKTVGGNQTDVAMSNCWDKSGSIYTTGSFSGTCDFNPSTATLNLSSNGLSDIFLSRYDQNGNHFWTKALGTEGMDTGFSVATDFSGNVYVAGTFSGSGDFDPNFGVSKLGTEGMSDIFILKLTAAGSFSWVKQIGGEFADDAKSIFVSDSGYILVTGSFSGKVDFNPSTLAADTFYLEAKGNKDIFVVKLNLNGGLIWAKNMGNAGASCQGTSIKADIPGNVLITGTFTDSVDFNTADTSAFFLKSAGQQDVFVTKTNKNGTFIWAKRFGGTGGDSCNAMATDITGTIVTTGSFNDTVDFNPAKEVYKLSSEGMGDIFVHKMASCTPIYTNIDDTICRPLTIDGVTYSESGFYKQTITNVGGCEEFITLNLDIHHINDTISLSGVTLTADATGVSYQWINCKTGKEIPGATGRSYITLGNSKYAVTLFDGRCRDTSECFEITSFPPVSISEFSDLKMVQIYPNPSNGTFNINIEDALIGASASIYNLLGQKIRTVELKESNTLQSLNAGFYLIEISKNKERIIRKLIVE